jgi:D-alanyl-D-alanine carboxypeptidase
MKKIWSVLVFLLFTLFWCSQENNILSPIHQQPLKTPNNTLYTRHKPVINTPKNIEKTIYLTPVNIIVPHQNRFFSGVFILPEKNIFSFHFEWGDNSITKFVNNKIWFTNKNYIPPDLILIQWEYILDQKWKQTIRKEANEYLQKLAFDFYQNFHVKLSIVSAYRSYEYQQWIKQNGCNDFYCAHAWYSEHQTWLAIDIFEATSKEIFLSKSNLKKYFLWFQENAFKYWFHNSYQNWPAIDWYAIEPWHWRYLWVNFATELQQNNMTYGKYYLKNGER